MKRHILMLSILGLLIAPLSLQAGVEAYLGNSGGDDTLSINVDSGAEAVRNFGALTGGIAVSPSGDRVYASIPASGLVRVFYTSTGTTQDINIGVGTGPTDLVLNSNGSRLYVANSTGSSVSVIETSDNSVTSITLGTNPRAIALNPTETRLYVIPATGTSMTVLHLNQSPITSELPTIELTSTGLGLNPSGSRIYVASNTDRIKIFGFNASNGQTIIINPTGGVTTSINDPIDIAVDPAGTVAYILNTNGGLANGNVVVLNIANDANSIVQNVSIPVGDNPRNIAVDPRGQRLVVTNEDSVTLVDLTKSALPTATIGLTNFAPAGIAFRSAPVLSAVSPACGATNMALDTTVSVTFSEAVTGIGGGSFLVTTLAGPVPGTIASIGTTARFTPNDALQPNTTYTVLLTTDITDGDGNALDQTSWTFTTGTSATSAGGGGDGCFISAAH